MLTDRSLLQAYGCLLGGLIGDAMGSRTENLEPAEIEARFGWVEDFEGTGTDDSLMRELLCEALIETDGYATADDWAAQLLRHRDQIFGEKRNRFFVSVLHTVEKLAYGYPPRLVGEGNMPSSSSAMAIAPVGIVNAGNPRVAAAQAGEIASLIHTGAVAFCQDAAAAVAAAVAAAFLPGADVEQAIRAGLAYLKPISGAEMRRLISSALDLARDTAEYHAFRASYHREFRRAIACDSRETVPATFALCWLARGDPHRAIVYGANFGRDTDTIATMAGALCGALAGSQSFPPAWVEKATASAARDPLELSSRLSAIARRKARRELAAWTAGLGPHRPAKG